VSEVLLSNDDITVLGPPEIVELLVDLGPQGIRGSKVFVGTGEPSTEAGGTLEGQTIILNDLYINTSPGANYGYLYQYVSQPGGNTWTSVLKINPTLYSRIFPVDFTAGTGSSTGSGSVTIAIANILTVTGSSLTAANFNVQYSISNTDPVVSTFITSIVGSNLVITFEASKYVSGTWTALNEDDVTIHILVTIVS